jgi:DNA-binding MarR family transcriptional regulator
MPTATEAAHEVLEVVPMVMRIIRAEMRSHSAPDLSVPQFRSLAFLNRHAGCSLSDLAEHVGLTLPSMSKLVDALVERKLVTRETYAGDRRRVTLALTPRGSAILESARESTLAWLAEWLGQLDAQERAVVVDAMRVLRPVFTSARARSANGNS